MAQGSASGSRVLVMWFQSSGADGSSVLFVGFWFQGSGSRALVPGFSLGVNIAWSRFVIKGGVGKGGL